MRWLAITCVVVVCAIAARPARADKHPPVAVIGLRPATKTVDGPFDIKRLGEAEKLRRVMNDVVRDLAHQPVMDDNALRATLGVEYLVDFVDCGGEIRCVSRLVRRLTRFTSTGVYGDYAVVDSDYQFRIRVFDIRHAKVLQEVEFKLSKDDIEDRQLWRRSMEPLFA